MKVFVFFALFVAIQATPFFSAPAILSTGDSTQYKSEDNFGNYNFGYDEGHLSGGSFRKEAGDAYGNKFGSYGLRDADGRIRIVNYVADSDGFRADIKTNEPGVESKDPASTNINKPSVIASALTYAASAPIAYAVAPAPVKAYSAPAPLAYAVAPAPFKTYYAPIPFSYGIAPTPSKTYAAAPSPLITYAAAPAPLKTYVAAPAPLATYAAPNAYYTAPGFYKPTIAV